MPVIPAITLEQLNLLLDSEIAAAKRAAKIPEVAQVAIIAYIESLQNRINRTAFDVMAKRADETDG